MSVRIALFVLTALASGASGQPAFDVASIKVFKGDGGPRNAWSWTSHGVTLGGCSLAAVIANAYNVPGGRILGPGSLTQEALWKPLSQGYDMVAKTDHPASKDELRIMLRSLLAERFGLALHPESKTRPVYKLVVARDGPKLEESHDVEASWSMSRNPGEYVFRNSELIRLSGLLSSKVDRLVVDATGLKGIYNFILKMPDDQPPDPAAKSAGASPDSLTASSFASAMKQLGLQLVATTEPLEYLVIDRVNPPTEN